MSVPSPPRQANVCAVDYSNGLRFAPFYPVEGDTAIAELFRGDEMWGDLRLEGIDLTAVGEARTSAVSSRLRLFGPLDGSQHWEFDYAGVCEVLQRAHRWLIENEQNRTTPSP